MCKTCVRWCSIICFAGCARHAPFLWTSQRSDGRVVRSDEAGGGSDHGATRAHLLAHHAHFPAALPDEKNRRRLAHLPGQQLAFPSSRDALASSTPPHPPSHLPCEAIVDVSAKSVANLSSTASDASHADLFGSVTGGGDTVSNGPIDGGLDQPRQVGFEAGLESEDERRVFFPSPVDQDLFVVDPAPGVSAACGMAPAHAQQTADANADALMFLTDDDCWVGFDPDDQSDETEKITR